MDVKFLKNTVEGYITKNELREHLDPNVIVDELYSLIKELRENDIELYHQLYDTGLMHKNKIIETYLEYEYGKDEVLEELGSLFLIGTGAMVLFSLIYRDRMTKKVLKIGKDIGKVFEKTGRYLTRLGRYWSFRYAIIQQNVAKCYRACGVNEKDISMWHYIATKADPIIGSKDSIKQGNCLSICYIDHTINSIDILSKSYFVCLKKTGDFQHVINAKPDALMNMLSGLQLSNACKDYYNLIRETFDKFYILLDYVYGKDETKKNKKISELRAKLIKSKKFIMQTKNFNQFK